MDKEINAFDFISMLVERSSTMTEVIVEFNKINRLRESLLKEDIPHDLGFYDFEEAEGIYPENITVMYESVRIKLSDNFSRVIKRRLSLTQSVEYIKMIELWSE